MLRVGERGKAGWTISRSFLIVYRRARVPTHVRLIPLRGRRRGDFLHLQIAQAYKHHKPTCWGTSTLGG